MLDLRGTMGGEGRGRGGAGGGRCSGATKGALGVSPEGLEPQQLELGGLYRWTCRKQLGKDALHERETRLGEFVQPAHTRERQRRSADALEAAARGWRRRALRSATARAALIRRGWQLQKAVRESGSRRLACVSSRPLRLSGAPCLP